MTMTMLTKTLKYDANERENLGHDWKSKEIHVCNCLWNINWDIGIIQINTKLTLQHDSCTEIEKVK